MFLGVGNQFVDDQTARNGRIHVQRHLIHLNLHTDGTVPASVSPQQVVHHAVNVSRGVNARQVLGHIQGLVDEGHRADAVLAVLDHLEDGRDYMLLRVERDQAVENSQDETLGKRIGEEIKKQILVSSNVEIVDYGRLPRSEGKSKRVFDHRDHGD